MMEINDVSKLPASARKVIDPYVADLKEAYGEEILSIFVYGSVTGVEYNPRRSDINVAVVLKDISFDKLKKGLKVIKKGRKQKINVPLFLTPHYIKDSLDTFPMEFMSMKNSRCLLFGEDVLSEIAVNRDDMRRECEFQLKSKMLTMRQAYLEQAMNRRGLENLIKTAFRSLMPVFQNMLRLKQGDTPPDVKEEILMALGDTFDIDVSSFLDLLKDERVDGKIGEKTAETFLGDFILELEKLADKVEHL
ncbi:MAG: hypothetical protein P9L88_06700 [Candidatus Tantalella remota]|nr:hypothetical protein [Candidatus Tantalella remota]